MKIRRLPPFLMMNGAGSEGGTPPPAPTAPPEGAPAPPAAKTEGTPAVPPAPAMSAADAAEMARLRAEHAAFKTKAEAFDAAEAEKLTEVERAQKRAQDAEQSAAASTAELLQLRYANENGITKEERVLLTATTEEALKIQAAAIVAHRAPGTASAQAAGITGGGAAPTSKPNTLEGALLGHFTKQ